MRTDCPLLRLIASPSTRHGARRQVSPNNPCVRTSLVVMVGGLDLHRQQITFDVVDVETRDVWRGRLWQPDRQRFRRWLREELTERAGTGTVKLAVEGCTGWRYVVEEICAAGFDAYLAEPADTQAARGRKRHAKTDRS